MNRKKEILKRLRDLREELRSADGAKVDEITTEVNTLKAELSQIETRESLFSGINGLDDNQQTGNPSPITTEITNPNNKPTETDEERRLRVLASPEYRSAWLNRLRQRPLTQIEQRAFSTAMTSAGAAVPTVTANMIVKKLEQTSALYARVTRTEIPGFFSVPVESATTAANWKAENAKANESDDSLKDVTFAGFELIKLVTVSKAAQNMTIDAFEGYIVEQISRKMSIAIEAAIAAGSGSGEPTGIINGVEFTDGTNKVSYTGKTGPTYDTFMDACALLPSAYHPNAVWLCSTKTKYSKIRKIKDNEGRPIFVDGMIDNKQVVAADQIPDGKIILCDPSYYMMNASTQITIDISDQAGFRNAQVDYRGYAVMDGKPLLSEAFVMIDAAA